MHFRSSPSESLITASFILVLFSRWSRSLKTPRSLHGTGTAVMISRLLMAAAGGACLLRSGNFGISILDSDEIRRHARGSCR